MVQDRNLCQNKTYFVYFHYFVARSCRVMGEERKFDWLQHSLNRSRAYPAGWLSTSAFHLKNTQHEAQAGTTTVFPEIEDHTRIPDQVRRKIKMVDRARITEQVRRA